MQQVVVGVLMVIGGLLLVAIGLTGRDLTLGHRPPWRQALTRTRALLVGPFAVVVGILMIVDA